jgi:hypothetical protein
LVAGSRGTKRIRWSIAWRGEDIVLD